MMLCAFRMCRKSPCKGYGRYPGMWSYRYPCKGVFKGHGRGRAEGIKTPSPAGLERPWGHVGTNRQADAWLRH